MASEQLLKRIESNLAWVNEHPDRFDIDVIEDSVAVAQYAMKTEKETKIALDFCKEIKGMVNTFCERNGHCFWETEHAAQLAGGRFKIIDLAYQVYKLEAPYLFESYLFYMEKNRKYEKRFYVPRRCTMKTVVDDMQRLENDELDLYGLSLPARTGKSTMGVFFLTWVGYRKPHSHSAAGGHSGMLAKRIFKGYVDLVSTEEYTFTELFSELHPEFKKPIERISSDPAEFIVNLGEPDAFATMSCRGADASWTGVIDVSGSPNSKAGSYDFDNDIGYLYVDDLVRDREHSMSASRMENTYQQYLNTMVDRCNDKAKRIIIATRWSVTDVLGREEIQNADNPRALFRKIPALNEDDKSNFLYEYHGFSSKYYIDMREKLDKPEWCAKYLQSPFVREGLLYPVEQLRFFDGKVPDEKKKVVAALDPAFGKGDYLSMPICFDYGDTEKYIVDWIYDSRTQGFTVPEIVDKIEEHFIMELVIEKNNGGDLMADNIQREMEERGVHHCHIVRKSAPVRMAKEDKIGAYADYVKRNFKFLPNKKWTETETEDGFAYRPSEQYRKAIDALIVYSPEGKNPHDDAPDAIAQLAMVFDGRGRRRQATIISSPV